MTKTKTAVEREIERLERMSEQSKTAAETAVKRPQTAAVCDHGPDCPAGQFCVTETQTAAETVDAETAGYGLIASAADGRDILTRVTKTAERVAWTFPGIDATVTQSKTVARVASWLGRRDAETVDGWLQTAARQTGLAYIVALNVCRSQSTGRGHIDRVDAELERSQGSPNWSTWLDEDGHQLPVTGIVQPWQSEPVGIPERDCESLQGSTRLQDADEDERPIAIALDWVKLTYPDRPVKSRSAVDWVGTQTDRPLVGTVQVLAALGRETVPTAAAVRVKGRRILQTVAKADRRTRPTISAVDGSTRVNERPQRRETGDGRSVISQTRSAIGTLPNWETVDRAAAETADAVETNGPDERINR